MDVSKITLDTPVKIKILTPGIWLPELETYTPTQSYASVEQVINILNRGIIVDFPQQSKDKREISTAIENILIDYELKKQELSKKNINVGSDINKAIDTIQDINDSHITAEEEREEQESHIFDHSDISNRIIKNLSDNSYAKVFEGDDYVTPEDRITRADTERKQKEIVAKKREALLREASDEAMVFKRLAQDAKYKDESFKIYEEELDFIDPSEGEEIDYSLVSKRKK